VLAHLLAADNLLEAAQTLNTVDAIGLSSDHDWIKRALENLCRAERAS